MLWSVLTLAAKSLQTHPGGSGTAVVVVVAGAAGAGAGGAAGVNVLALVLTAGAVVVVVEGDGFDVVGVVLTRATGGMVHGLCPEMLRRPAGTTRTEERSHTDEADRKRSTDDAARVHAQDAAKPTGRLQPHATRKFAAPRPAHAHIFSHADPFP